MSHNSRYKVRRLEIQQDSKEILEKTRENRILVKKCRNSKRQIKSVSFQIAIQEQKMQFQFNYFHFQLTEQCTKNGKDRQSSISQVQ